MNKRHIQTFLTVSAAFFAISAPLRSNATESASAGTLAHTTHVVPCLGSMDRSCTGVTVDHDGQQK
jgi:hypothetical protein